MSNGLTFELYNIFYKILMIDAKWLANRPHFYRIYKISWKSFENWQTTYGKGNFYFGPSSTVGQTLGLSTLTTHTSVTCQNRCRVVLSEAVDGCICFIYVSNKKTNSDMYRISTGVPQGSISGPLLFIIYINGLCNASKLFKMIIYADDTTLYSTLDVFGNYISKNLNLELTKVAD